MDLQNPIELGRAARAVRWLVDLPYIAPLSRYIPVDVWRWGVCGVGNYIVLDSVLYYIIYHYLVAYRYLDLGVVVISPHILSLIILFPITFTSGFWLNRNVAFGAIQRSTKYQLWRYGVSIIGSLLINYLTIKVLVEGFELWATPSKIVGSLITSLYSFAAARFFTFKG